MQRLDNKRIYYIYMYPQQSASIQKYQNMYINEKDFCRDSRALNMYKSVISIICTYYKMTKKRAQHITAQI